MKVIEIAGAIPKLYQDHLETELSAAGMQWNYQEESARSASKFDANFSGFSHTAYLTEMDTSEAIMSPLTSLLLPALYMFCDKAEIEFNQLLRIRIGLFTRNTMPAKHHNPHVDFVQPHHTACYYVNDCDGNTTIFKETVEQVPLEDSARWASKNKFNVAARVSPQKGKMMCFDGLHYHASMHPVKAGKRLVVTYNWV